MPQENVCTIIAQKICDYLDGALGGDEKNAVEMHLNSCPRCNNGLQQFRAVQGFLGQTLDAAALKEISREDAIRRFQAAAAEYPVEEDSRPVLAAMGNPTFLDRLGGAPWWGVSLLLHSLVIALTGLISMAIALPPAEDVVITITELAPRPQIDSIVSKPAPAPVDALHSKHETPPTDPTSKEASEIVVPPDILARAQFGDHFETINPDRPDTLSAFGNSESHMFHSEAGSDDAEGGGGAGGDSLEEVIGAGRSASPGSGGGWGGGNGSGIGVGNGSGRGSFGNRDGGGRKLMVKRHGGSPATEGAVERALYWLARHQEADGHWDCKKYGGNECLNFCASGYDESISAVATLAFLGAGHTPRVGIFKDNVRRSLQWIVARQQADGSFATPGRHQNSEVYDNAICTLALAEAFGMTRDKRFGDAAERGVQWIVKAQNPNGGWRHCCVSTSVAGWMIMALKSAKVAGINVPPQTFENAIKYLSGVAEKDADGYFGVMGYSRRGEILYSKGLTMTAVGMTSMQFMGLSHETSRMADILARNPPEWKAGLDIHSDPQNFYHWYYATLGMFQVGGPQWKSWNSALQKTLLPNQRKGGDPDGTLKDVDGSWDPVTTWDATGGRVYTTALGALCLEVYYRYVKLNAD